MKPGEPAIPISRATAGKTKPRWRRLLRAFFLAILVLVLGVCAFIGAVTFKYNRIVHARPREITDVRPLEFGKWVDPFIGTGGIPWVCPNNFPGAMRPFGMVRLGPETTSILTHKRALNTSGYYYGDDQVLGFSHTRLNGTGATDGGHFLVTPAGEPIDPANLRERKTLQFSHSDEMASPGYYAVKLPQIGVLAELTATPRVGVHRYSFMTGKPAHIYLDASNALGGHRSAEGKIAILPQKQELVGQIRTFGTFASRYGGLKVYFAARFDRPFATFSTWQGDKVLANQESAEGDHVGADVSFASATLPLVVTLKLAISHVSVENARANLEAEGGGDFETTLKAAQRAWEEKLSLVRIQGGSEKEKRIFYTALSRIFQMPTLFSDVNGEYLGLDKKVHQAQGHNYYTDFSMWDTFRTVHPLYTLLTPADQRDMVVSLQRMMEQGGWLPRWPSGAGYSNSMLGTPADIVIAEAYLKGIRGFDVEALYQAMRRTALAPVPAGSAFSGREGVENYLKYEYCPSGLVRESVSKTFEYGWADRAISNLAEALGHAADAELFRKHSRFYTNLWNPQSQYFQPRDAAGKFFEPFKPLLLTYLDRKGEFTKDYVEGSALQWRWGAPYDAQEMIGLFKSREFFVNELDEFMSKSTPDIGHWNPGPYYWQGNQPDIHAAYLFNDAGRPDLTQKWVRWILENKYSDTYGGLDGNDDAGTLSAWYVLGALGFYPVPGSDKYELGAPLFEKAEIKMGTNLLSIVAENSATNPPYVQAVHLNDQVLNRTWFRHQEIQSGGTLRFKMSDQPAVSSLNGTN